MGVRTVPSKNALRALFNAKWGHPSFAKFRSVKDVFLHESYGNFVIENTVADWVTISNTETYYANNEYGIGYTVHTALHEALTLVLDAGVIKFKDFDVFENGFAGDYWFDAVSFLQSGYSAKFPITAVQQ